MVHTKIDRAFATEREVLPKMHSRNSLMRAPLSIFVASSDLQGAFDHSVGAVRGATVVS